MCTAASNVTIANELGLHARPAMMVQETAGRFESEVTVRRLDNGETGSAANMMGLLALMLMPGTEVEIAATGPDAEAAVAAVVELIKDDFDLA